MIPGNLQDCPVSYELFSGGTFGLSLVPAKKVRLSSRLAVFGSDRPNTRLPRILYACALLCDVVTT